MKYKKILITAIIIASTILFIKNTQYTYFTIKFDELEPFETHMPIYYKGFKVGHTIKTQPNSEFTHTYIKSIITYNKISFPLNTTAIVRRRSKKFFYDVQNYIELKIPDAPLIDKIKSGSIIEGKNSENLETLITKHIENGTIDDIAQEIQNLTKNLNAMVTTITDIFLMLDDILAENRTNLLTSSRNLAKITTNINSATFKINNSLHQSDISDTFADTKFSSKNIADFTENLNIISKNINSMQQEINSVIINTNSTMYNISKITEGILDTLNQRLGLLKLMFGNSIKKGKCR